MENDLGEHPSGELKRESAEVKSERIIDEELPRLGWSRSELSLRRKGDPAKLAIGNRLRKEAVLSVAAIAAKLHLGSPKSARARLREQKLQKPGISASASPWNPQQSTFDNVALP